MTKAAAKAKELVHKYRIILARHFMIKEQLTSYAKACASEAVDEILSIDVWNCPHNAEQGVLYWEQVKEEIKKL